MDPVELAELNDHFAAIAVRAAAAFDHVARVDPASAAQARSCRAQARELAALHLGHAAANQGADADLVAAGRVPAA